MVASDFLEYYPETGNFYWKVTNINVRERDKVQGTKRSGYIRISVGGRIYSAHRLAFELMGEEVPDQVDHINGIRDDNRWCNLRAANQQLNQWNTGPRKSNTTGYKNVYYRKRGDVYVGFIATREGRLYVGSFKTAELANEAVLSASQKHQGEFSFDNNIRQA